MDEGFIGTGRVRITLALKEAAVIVGLHFLKADSGHIQMIEGMGEDLRRPLVPGVGTP